MQRRDPAKSTGEIADRDVAHVLYDCSRQGRARTIASHLIDRGENSPKVPRLIGPLPSWLGSKR